MGLHGGVTQALRSSTARPHLEQMQLSTGTSRADQEVLGEQEALPLAFLLQRQRAQADFAELAPLHGRNLNKRTWWLQKGRTHSSYTSADGDGAMAAIATPVSKTPGMGSTVLSDAPALGAGRNATSSEGRRFEQGGDVHQT